MRNQHTLMSVVLCLAWACTAPEKGEVISTWPSSGHPKEVHTVLGEGAGTEVQILHENGSIHMRGTLLEGKRNGVWNTYREDGMPWSQVQYDSGTKEGLFRTWHVEGVPHIEGQHLGGEPSGTWRFYGTDGQLVHTEDYDTAN
jgi:antitoxin component YwqK of YwqJK toxin-antitoxin module